jgi:hypothetical protein
MSEPVITCPNCHSEIKLTESIKLTLAAPVIEAARKEYEARAGEVPTDRAVINIGA